MLMDFLKRLDDEFWISHEFGGVTVGRVFCLSCSPSYDECDDGNANKKPEKKGCAEVLLWDW